MANEQLAKDGQVICEWLHDQWRSGTFDWGGPANWWPAMLDLNHLHLVERRLSHEQWKLYQAGLYAQWAEGDSQVTDPQIFFIHADAAQKIAALAQVIRAEKKV